MTCAVLAFAIMQIQGTEKTKQGVCVHCVRTCQSCLCGLVACVSQMSYLEQALMTQHAQRSRSLALKPSSQLTLPVFYSCLLTQRSSFLTPHSHSLSFARTYKHPQFEGTDLHTLFNVTGGNACEKSSELAKHRPLRFRVCSTSASC